MIFVSSAPAFAVAAVSDAILIMIHRRQALVVSPNDRSMHTDSTPLGGGVGCALGIAAACAVSK
jgi:UDP-N-acetylmuramyl pentapeptide phosphotransferase/UDP-N-acetylglucosamine-1-phosphate transferase